MTLTTHGTEYFRDPEMVRMALKGVKVHEVDGAKFDVFATGAVLYSLVENSFPAHGGMSLLSKRCPEAVRWVVRRSMAEYNQRYASSYEMYADLEAVLGANDMYAVMPADLPSVKGGVDASAHDDPTPDEATRVIAAGSPGVPADKPESAPAAERFAANPPTPTPTPEGPTAPGERAKPRLSLVNWWTGSYAPRPGRPGPGNPVAGERPDGAAGWRPWRDGSDEPLIDKAIHKDQFAPADQQLRRARARVGAARQRAHQRRTSARQRRRRRDRHTRQLNPGVGVALVVFLCLTVLGAAALLSSGTDSQRNAASSSASATIDQNNGIALNLDSNDLDGLSIFNDLKDLRGLRGMPTQIVEALADAGIYDQDRGVLTFEDEGNTITIKAPNWLQASNTTPDDQPEAPVAAPPATPAKSLGRVLVINSLDGSADETTNEKINAGLKRLTSLGFSIVGLSQSDEDIAMTGAALHEIGLGTGDDPATIERLKTWLKDSDGSLEGLVWISRDRPVESPVVLMRGRATERRIERLFHPTQ